MMKSATRTAAVVVAVAVVAGAATAASSPAQVRPSAKQYAYGGGGGGGSGGGGDGCRQEEFPCGTDYSRCTTQYGVCVQHGCNKDEYYPCPYTIKVKFDCEQTTFEEYTRKERRTYECDKSYEDTQWVKGGCTKYGKVRFDCEKTFDEDCKKTREVSFQCEKTRTVDCKKEVEATCTKKQYKQCYGDSYEESYPCTKFFDKDVYCKGSYGYGGKTCTEKVAFKSTCTRTVPGKPYDCSVEESYPCKKFQDVKCDQKYEALCKRTETYDAKCPVTRWVKGGCEKDGQIKFDCNVTTTKTFKGECEYYEDVKDKRAVTKWVKDGCEKEVQKDKQCKKQVWDPKCCAKREDKKTCEVKYCYRQRCY